MGKIFTRALYSFYFFLKIPKSYKTFNNLGGSFLIKESTNKFLEERDFVSLLGLCPLVPFDLYWKKKNGEKVLLKSCGDICHSSDLERWLNKGINLETDSTLNEEWLGEGLTKLFEFVSLQSVDLVNQRAIQNWRIDFINWLYPALWEEQQSISRLDVCFLVGSVFYSLNEEQESLFLNFPIEIQRKNFLSATFGVLLAISLGYMDLKFLKEYFTILLFMDYPFCRSMWSENERTFIKQEWSMPGLGQVLYEQVGTRVFNLYDQEGEQLHELFEEHITHKSLLKYLKWSFARLNGSGRLPYLKQEELSDLDILTIFLNHSFSYDENLKEIPQTSLIRRLFQVSHDFKELNLNTRVENIIKTAFERAQELKSGYLEIVGL